MSKQEITQLRTEIDRHNALYYRDATPEITDEAYDALFARLVDLEWQFPELASKDSPTQRLAIKPAEGFTKIRHLTRMLSIGNTFEQAGIEDFDKKMRVLTNGEVEYSGEPKFDGLAISLVYRKGRLVTAGTRGDYEEGEDVTANAYQIASIPNEIAYMGELDVRGEVMLPIARLDELNAERRANGEKEYANTRNAAAGALRLLDAAETGRRGLVFKAYSITDATLPEDVSTQSGVMNKLYELGFPVDENRAVVVGKDGIQGFYDHLAEIRHSLPFDIDGVVFKVNDLALQHEAGYVSREPRAMIAYKFNQQEAYTKLLSIDIQIGRTGALTPVARLAPINLGGVVVQNATLHNMDEIARIGVKIGDTVKVRRNGDVIPGITGVDQSKRDGSEVEFKMPAECPCCESPVEKDKEEDAVMRCTGGDACDEQAVQGLIYFVSRAGMNIDSVGESLCRQLFDEGLVRTPDQLYQLTVEQLLRLDGFGKKSANNTIDSINASRTPALRKFLVALGIRNAGEGTAKRLEAAFGSLEAIRAASITELSAVKDVGDVVARSVYDYFRDRAAMVDRLVAELDIKNPQVNTNQVDGIAGKTFVITGTLDGMSRDEAKVWIESMGGVTSGSVSKKTHFLLAGAEAGSKLDKANTLGVAVLSLDDLREMAGSVQDEAELFAAPGM
ncbi:MAG: NAD-dependent DNA ligase LigA [Sideroxyarcus sp.]|nr:NAD-dependent DNA ligase LigA [Sideroxyarcus sp.]